MQAFVLVGLFVFVLVVSSYFLFRDTMNRIQYIQTLRIYWITKDNGSPDIKRFSKAFMRQDSYPWWRGKGIQLRIARWTVQVGKLTDQGQSLADQLGEWMDVPVTELRAWGRPQEDNDGDTDEDGSTDRPVSDAASAVATDTSAT